MLRLKYAIFLLLVCVLTACGDAEPVPELTPQPTLPPKHMQATATVWDNLTISEITPTTAFEQVSDSLRIYPYFDGDSYILMKKIFLSNNNFWDTATQSYTDTDNYIKTAKYSLITLDNGYTVAMIPIDEETAYVVTTNQLPSAYVKKVCDIVCQ